jgi:hypothetical protein
MTSVLLSPVIFITIYFFSDHQSLSISLSGLGSLLQGYFGLIMVGGVLSLITWLFFWGIGIVTCRHTTNVTHRKLIMSLMGIILTILTFLFVFSCLFSYKDAFTDMPLAIMLSYCLCIGAGSLFYNLGPNESIS